MESVITQTYNDLKLNVVTSGRGSSLYKLEIPSDIDLTKKDLILKLRPILEDGQGKFSDPDLWVSKVIC